MVCSLTANTICDWILENLPFGHKQTFEKTRLKTLTMFLKLSFFAHLDKATITPSCCEVSHQKLGDMDDYIRSADVPKR